MYDTHIVIRARVASHKVVLLTQISPVADYSLNTGDWGLATALLMPRAISPQGRRPSLPTMPLMCLLLPYGTAPAHSSAKGHIFISLLPWICISSY